MGKFDDLEKLQKLRDSGVLTEEEFETEKNKILNGLESSKSQEKVNKKSKAKIFFILAGIFLVITIVCIIITLYMNNKFYHLTDESDYAWSKYLYDETKSAYNYYERIIEEMGNAEDIFKIFLYISFGIGAITIIMLIIGIVLKVKKEKNMNNEKKKQEIYNRYMNSTENTNKSENKENSDIHCKKCGNKIEIGERFCGKCGTKVIEEIKNDAINEINNNLIKKRLLYFIIIIVIILIIGGISGGIYYSNTIITDKYLTEKFKENGFSKYDDINVEILDMTNIDYQEFNKLVFVKRTVENDGASTSACSFLLVNKKEDKLDGFDISSSISFILNGVASNEKSKIENITKISAEYIQNNGIDFFNDTQSESYKNLMKEYSEVIGLENCRTYIESGVEEQVTTKLGYTPTNATLLFEKGSPIVKYIAYYETNTVYNSSYGIDEQTYKWMIKKYKYKEFFENMEYVYGPAYTTVNEYVVYEITNTVYTEEELEETKVGSYSSLEKAKEKLDVEE